MTEKILTDDKLVFQKKIKHMVAKTGYGLMTQQFVAAIASVVFYDNREFFKKLIMELIDD